MLRHIEDRSVLTLAQFERFDQRGGIIRLWLETPESDSAQQGIRFAVNLEVANRVGITLSSKVLRYAAARAER